MQHPILLKCKAIRNAVTSPDVKLKFSMPLVIYGKGQLPTYASPPHFGTDLEFELLFAKTGKYLVMLTWNE